MRASVAQAKARFSEMIDAARGGEPVIVTRHGQPVVAVVPLPEDSDDRERFLLAYNPVFRSIIEASRSSGDPISHDAIWRLATKGRGSARDREAEQSAAGGAGPAKHSARKPRSRSARRP